MLEREKYLIIQQVHQMNGSVLTPHCDNIDHWTLHNCFNGTFHLEVIDFLLLNDVPKLHMLVSIEHHFVHIGHWMHQTNQNLFVLF